MSLISAGSISLDSTFKQGFFFMGYGETTYICLLDCTENPIYVFPEMKLQGLVSSYIHVSVSDLYIYIFNLKSFDLRLTFGRPHLFSLILLCVLQDILLTSIGQKKASSHSFAISKDTHSRDIEKSSVQSDPRSLGQKEP
jgi:hypothetical protein